MKRTFCRLLTGIVATAALSFATMAQAGFPQTPPAFPPPVGVEPLPPIIIPDPPPPPPPAVQQTPEPATIGMALFGAGLAYAARRRRSVAARN